MYHLVVLPCLRVLQVLLLAQAVRQVRHLVTHHQVLVVLLVVHVEALVVQIKRK